MAGAQPRLDSMKHDYLNVMIKRPRKQEEREAADDLPQPTLPQCRATALGSKGALGYGCSLRRLLSGRVLGSPWGSGVCSAGTLGKTSASAGPQGAGSPFHVGP